MEMKGFIINLDGTIALSFVLFAMLIIFSQSYNPRAPEGVYLKQLTLDTLAVLEKTGRVEQMLKDNETAVQEIVEATPKLACMRISVIDSNGNIVDETTKSDCNETINLDMQTTTRPVLHLNESYIIKSEAWFRKEPG